ncbi:MAG TPA: tetraprenyl-beta-curcumene synthase family protein [Smithellaceae bacterium]|nr:tetraprenyl-beta-curcumene synthase family protein [Smithellaceae bacterium]
MALIRKGEPRAPADIITMTTAAVTKVHPVTRYCLGVWKEKAREIPDDELRRQAQASLEAKRFHCEGGALYGLLAGTKYREAVKFIVAYQTISDYLDNLCDRSTSQDPDDFYALHESMQQALTPGTPLADYYRFRREKDDGGYLAELVRACREVLNGVDGYPAVRETLLALASLYVDLQIHKHVQKDERVPRLKSWFAIHQDKLPPMSWYEFAACTGSTLGIFCIVSEILNSGARPLLAEKIKKAYFPWMQGLHILLDYLIDQEEDRREGDLNFCNYYESAAAMSARFEHFYLQSLSSVESLPNKKFHRLIVRGLLAIYLADPKVSGQEDVRALAKNLLRLGGWTSYFFYLHCRIYRSLSG